MGAINCKDKKSTSYTVDGGIEENDSKNRENPQDEVIEKEICQVDDIGINEMKEYELAEGNKVLLVRTKQDFYAVGTKCTHYGAPLIQGALGENNIRCPWHGACFNLKTGDIEDFPGLDSLPCYKVSISDDNKVKVSTKKRDLGKNKRIKEMEKRDESDKRTFVVIGGGPSAGVCVETLRQEGFKGRIVMICKENALPYDRVKVSKTFTFELDKLQMRDMNFYEENGIEVWKGIEAIGVDAITNTVTCSNDDSIKYDKLYIATGCEPRRLDIPGSNLNNIMTIRDFKDAMDILNILKPEMEIVCLGASFISLESAAYLVGKVKKITIIGKDEFPLQSSFGKEIGERILKLFKEKDVEMLMRNGITKCNGDDVIQSVTLKDDRTLPCDLLILGIGSKLSTTFLKNSGIAVNSNGSVDTDMHLRTNVPNVYAGGDLANSPVFSIANQRATISHYQLAQYHGKIAALNMVGKITALKAVPFFFTTLFGKGLRYAGYGKPYESIIEGDLEALKFVAFYFDAHGNVTAVASCNRDPVVAQFAEFTSQGRRLHKNDLKDDPFAWTKQITV